MRKLKRQVLINFGIVIDTLNKFSIRDVIVVDHAKARSFKVFPEVGRGMRQLFLSY